MTDYKTIAEPNNFIRGKCSLESHVPGATIGGEALTGFPEGPFDY
jgi:hypothetical protein